MGEQCSVEQIEISNVAAICCNAKNGQQLCCEMTMEYRLDRHFAKNRLLVIIEFRPDEIGV